MSVTGTERALKCCLRSVVITDLLHKEVGEAVFTQYTLLPSPISDPPDSQTHRLHKCWYTQENPLKGWVMKRARGIVGPRLKTTSGSRWWRPPKRCYCLGVQVCLRMTDMPERSYLSVNTFPVNRHGVEFKKPWPVPPFPSLHSNGKPDSHTTCFCCCRSIAFYWPRNLISIAIHWQNLQCSNVLYTVYYARIHIPGNCWWVSRVVEGITQFVQI